MPKTTLESILLSARQRVASLAGTKRELERRAAAAVSAPPFFSALRPASTVGVIAEVKRRSPSAGDIATSLDPVAHAQAYVRGGAVAISVLTDEVHFGGSLEDLERVAHAVQVPVLRKDFILDELQLLEARAAGASAVLLIVRALSEPDLRKLSLRARYLGLGLLIEAHSERELELALEAQPTAVGINSRDLDTFTIDRDLAERLVSRVPYGIPAIAESGIETRDDVARFAAAGADLVLVGTSVAKSADPGAAVQALCGLPRQERRLTLRKGSLA